MIEVAVGCKNLIITTCSKGANQEVNHVAPDSVTHAKIEKGSGRFEVFNVKLAIWKGSELIPESIQLLRMTNARQKFLANEAK
jgi:hypothetical protein